MHEIDREIIMEWVDRSCCNCGRNIDFYTMIAPFYDGLVGPFLRSARKDIIRSARAEKCRYVLEVACGTGEQAIMLAKEGFEVTGIDLSPAMLGVARAKSPSNIGYFLGNAASMPFRDGSFDCVTISLALHEMESHIRAGVAGEMLRVLAEGGRLILLDYSAPEVWKPAAGLALLGLVERIAGAEHFRNFVRFTRAGGLEKFLGLFPLKIIRSRSYFLGALRLFLAEKEPFREQ